MSTLSDIFINNLLPILLIAGTGYLLGKWLQVDPRSLSRIIFYIFTPCLIFDLLVNSRLSNGDMLRMVGFAASIVLSVGVVTWLIGRALKLKRRILAAVLLTTMCMNAGNYGLSLNLFAFGEAALSQASIYFITTALMTNTLGVTIASMGRASLKQSLLELFKIPTIYAVVLAMVFISQSWQLPIPLERTTSLLSDAAIPAMLVLLGLQLQRNQMTRHLPALILSNGMRLIGSPVLALGLAAVFGLQGIAYQAGILQAATPTAVLSTVLSTEYDVEPAFVTTVVFTTTLLSPLTLTPLLAYLGA
ncbi:MAG: AEC family transporter [Chloroflexi bacterium]|nr:AEC family transporter [Chloroflexota bacterium]MBU1660362.1 AEC family transporter [Chloroflexota bacterium]